MGSLRHFDMRRWLAFVLLADLSGHAHELFHHVVGRIVCGGWGEITFWVFALAPGCDGPQMAIVTAAGPALTYGLAWLGVALIARRQCALGVALVFAQFTWQRLLVSLFTNDERRLRLELLPPGALAWIIEAVLLVVVALPPLVVACRTLRRAGALGSLWLYCVGGVAGWASFVAWNPLSHRLPIGATIGVSNWYFVIITIELLLVWHWREPLGRAWSPNDETSRSPPPT